MRLSRRLPTPRFFGAAKPVNIVENTKHTDLMVTAISRANLQPMELDFLPLELASFNSILHAKQITPIDSQLSDHKGILIHIGGGFEVVFLNWTMLCQQHNNGFKKIETREEYRTRLAEIARLLSVHLKAGRICMGAESMIKPDDIIFFMAELKSLGCDNARLYLKGFGGSVIFPNKRVKKAFFHDESLSDELSDLAIRCQLFHTSDAYSIANVHVPFRETEAAFTKILYAILSKKIDSDFEGVKCLDWIGDKNISPETQLELSIHIVNTIFEERKLSGKEPITVISYLVTSPDGHLQNHDGEESLVNVDSCHRFVIYPSKKYGFQHMPEKVAYREYTNRPF